MEINKVYNEDCLITMSKMSDNFIDLTITSPPYDNLRTYNGYSFDFENIVKELYRITKQGGIVVWVVGDATIDGSESGTSFRQALYFMECGFKLHDTMIYQKSGSPFPPKNRYTQIFEYMFIFSKGKPSTFNPIMKKNVTAGDFRANRCYRQKNGKMKEHKPHTIKEEGVDNNIWYIKNGYMKSTKDKIAYKHPAIFPDELAHKHIISWSNEGDIVFDPFIGSGTVAKIAIENNRAWIGCEISQEYCDIIDERLKKGVKTP
jgi:site-specific DNA-methyltransferase (adenine-specific)